MPKWYDITRKDDYQSLPPEQQSAVKQRFFERYVLPEIDKNPKLSGDVDVQQAAFIKFMQTPDDSGQGYVSSLVGSAGRGFGEVVPGAIEGAGALSGISTLEEAGQAVRGGLEYISPVNPLYEDTIPSKLASTAGQVGAVIGTGGIGGLTGKALAASKIAAGTTAAERAIIAANAFSKGASTGVYGSAGLQGAAGGAQAADQYGMEGGNRYARILAGAATELGTELLPFGAVAETGVARKLLGGAADAVPGVRTSTFTEAAEEGASQFGGNLATQVLAPEGVETPGLGEGVLESAALGGFGGALMGVAGKLASTPQDSAPAPTGEAVPPAETETATANVEIDGAGTWNSDSGVPLEVAKGIIESKDTKGIKTLIDNGVLTPPQVIPVAEDNPALAEIGDSLAVAKVAEVAPETISALEATIEPVVEEAVAPIAPNEEQPSQELPPVESGARKADSTVAPVDVEIPDNVQEVPVAEEVADPFTPVVETTGKKDLQVEPDTRTEAGMPSTPPQRDTTKPEQMTPGEYASSERDPELPKNYVLSDGNGNFVTEEKNGWFKVWRLTGTHATLAGTVGFKGAEGLAKAKARLKEVSAEMHEEKLQNGIRTKKPVSKAAVDAYGITLPEGYVKQGDLYVFQPQPTAAETQTSGVAVERDLTNLEQMTPDEVNSIWNDAKDWANTPDSEIVAKYQKQFNASDAYIQAHPFAPEYWRETQRKIISGASPLKQHTKVLNSAIAGKKPVSAAAVDAYGITLPQGYVKQGELYVFSPQTKESETETAATEGTVMPGGSAIERDTSKPEQMTPEERRDAKIQVIAVETEKGLKPIYYLAIREGDSIGIYGSNYSETDGELIGSAKPVNLIARPTLEEVRQVGSSAPAYIEKLAIDEGAPIYRANGIGVQAAHQAEIASARLKKAPVSKAAVDTYGITLPEGYVRQGDLYVFSPQTAQAAAETQTPAPSRKGAGVAPDPFTPADDESVGAARNAEAIRQAAARLKGTEKGPDLGFSKQQPTGKKDLQVEPDTRTEAGMPSTPPQRDPTKPEQMTPEESYEAYTTAKNLAPNLADMPKTRKQIQEGIAIAENSGIKDSELQSMLMDSAKSETGQFAGPYIKAQRIRLIEEAMEGKKPVSAEAVDAYQIALPEGYVRQGELYIFQPSSEQSGLGAGAATAPAKEQMMPDEIEQDPDIANVVPEKERGGRWSNRNVVGDQMTGSRVVTNFAIRPKGPVVSLSESWNQALRAQTYLGKFDSQELADAAASQAGALHAVEDQEVDVDAGEEEGHYWAVFADKDAAWDYAEANDTEAPSLPTPQPTSPIVETPTGSLPADEKPMSGDSGTVRKPKKAPRKPKSPKPVTEQNRAPVQEEEVVVDEAPRPLPPKYKPNVGDLVSGTVNGVPVVGKVTRVSGGGTVTAEYGNGKEFITNNPVPAAQALATAPKYQYTQEQNTAKAARLGLPTTPGVTENAGEVIRNVLVNVSKDTRLSPLTRAIARALLSVNFDGVRLRIKADGRSGAGLYTHEKGTGEIMVNLRAVARGQVDSIGVFLHEALHHATLEKLFNPAPGIETEAVDAIKKIVDHVKTLAGPDTVFDYELGSPWEFVSALFTRPDFQNYLATVPAPGSPTGIAKFRSALSELFRRLAELVTGQKVQKGSTMEQAIAATMVLFETPQRTGDGAAGAMADRDAAPIDPSQSNERPTDIPERVRGAGTQVPPAEGGGNAASVLARLDAGREAAVSAAVAESDWGNYTPEQKTEALNAFIRSVYLAAEHSLRTAFRGVGGILFTRGDEGSASARGVVGAEGRLQLVLTYDNSAGFENGVKGDALARDMFAFAYDTAQEEIIHAADKVAEFRRWVAAGRPGTLNSFSNREALRTFNQINQARIDLQQTDPAAAQKIKGAMLASWEVYHNEPVEGIAGLARRLGEKGKDGFGPSAYLYELRRQLTQLKRQDFTTETGWQKFTRVLKQWLTDAINALRGVQGVFRSGMAGDLIQRQLVDLEAALDGKPLPAKGARYAASTSAPATSKLSPDKARAILTKRFGKAGGKFVVGAFNADGDIEWDAKIGDGNITLNLKYLDTEAKLIAKAEHELAHAVFDDPAVQQEWKAISRTLSPAAREKLAARLKGLGYADSVLDEEMLVQTLEEIRRNTPPEAWQRFVKAVRDALLRLFGMDVSQGDAERAAARIVAAGEAALAQGLDPAVAAFGQSAAESAASRRHAELEAKFNAGTITPEETAEAQALVDQAAKAAGYSERTFHGSKNSGFTVFDPKLAGRGVVASNSSGGFYFSSSQDQASWFADPVTVERTGEDLSEEDVAVYGDSPFYALVGDTISGGPFPTEDAAQSWGESIVDKWNSAEEGEVVFEDDKVMQTYLQLGNPLEVEGMSEFRAAERTAKKDGYDSIVARDVSDGPEVGDVFIVFDPNQIKSADPFTGVPLDRRFDAGSNDIRYSRVPDAELNEQTNVQFGSEKQRNIRPAAPQQETANKASAIIGEAIAKDPVNGRMNALLRFDSDTKLPLEVRAIGAAMLAEQVEYLNVLSARAGNAPPEATDLADDFVDRAISIVQRLGTELGRGLNTFNALARLTPEGFIRRRMRQHAKGVDEVIRQNFTGDLRGDVEKAFSETPEVPEAEAVKKVRGSLPDTLAKKAIERFNALLDGPVPPGQKNPLSELIAKNVKSPVEGFKEKLIELGVDPEVADSLDAVSAKLRAEYTEAARLKAIDKLLAVKTRNKTAKEKLSKVIRTVLEAGNLGAMDSQQFMDLFAKEFGLPPMTKEFKAEIKEMVRGINALPKGPARIDAIQALEEKLALWEGIKTRDVLMSTWYANILSGVSTQAIGLLYNNLNLFLKSAVTMLANPKSAKAFVQGALGEGLRTGLKEAVAALQGRGLYKASKWGDKKMIDSLGLLSKQGPRGAAQWAAYLASVGTLTRKVFHVMEAVDALAWNTAREGHAYLAAHRALREELASSNPTAEEFSRKFVEKLGGDTAQIEADLREARDQRIAAGASPDLTTIDRMARQMRDDRRTKAGADLQSSNRFADRVVVQQEPEGIGRLISALITAIQQVNVIGVPVGQMLVPFNKIVSNLFEQSLDYTPVGIIRGALGGHLTDVVQFNKDGIKFREGSKMFDSTERWERAITGTLATSIGFALYALAASMKDEDDEDVPFMIYAFGPTDKNKRSQMPKGWAPFTIKIGDVYYKFAEAPFGMMFAGIGSALDAIRYEKMDDKTAVDKLTYVMKSAAKGFMTQGVLSSVDTAIDVLMLKASDKKLSDIPVSAMKGAIPGQGFLRDLSTLTDDRKIDGSTMKAALLRDIPFVKSYAGKPELNAFGEPVTFDGLPVVRRFVNGVEKNHVADYLGRNDLYIPGMPPTIEVGSYLPKEMKDRLQRRALEVSAMENGMFTPEQNYEFKKRAGQLTKVAVERIMSASPPITNDVQRKKVQSVLNKQIEIARKRAMLEAVPIK